MLSLVAASSRREWAIRAPAAFHRSGSRFSGSLSGIEPLFSVTRDSLCSPLHYKEADRSVLGPPMRQSETVRYDRMIWVNRQLLGDKGWFLSQSLASHFITQGLPPS